jgi:serine-type D-Ala-D-Ala carboxypeptidase/endopeptidase (penicillin-binding protein 4)
MRRDRGAASALLAVGLFAASQSAPLAAAAPGPSAFQRPPTPILSARRDPAWVDTIVARQRLARVLASTPSGPPGASACIQVSQDGSDLFSRDPAVELLPASNLKVVTAYAGLELLGPGSRFTTLVEGAAREAGGVLSGNLYLVGGGDPNLMTDTYDHAQYYPHSVYTSLNRLAAAVKAAGVHTVTGAVVGDAHRYDSLVGVPSWSPVYLSEGDVGPLSALEVNDGSPAPPPPPTPGQPPTKQVTPPPGPAKPTLFAAQIFESLLKADGVDVERPAGVGRAPASGVTITSATSPPMSEEVEQMLRVSDDTAAELLTKEIGYRVSGQGTTMAGVAALQQRLVSDGLPAGQFVFRDGSGLDRGDRATCQAIVSVLERAGSDGLLAAGLPVAGTTGTLTRRFLGTPAAGRLRAKTGTLDGVSSLSGVVQPRPGAATSELSGPVYFSLIVNGGPAGQDQTYLDRLAVAVAGFPDAVSMSLLEPSR